MAHFTLIAFHQMDYSLKQDRSNPKSPIQRVRLGRPPANQAGEVNKRILDAATSLFLEHGFGRTTFDQVAELAHVGKTTLYSRFSSKEALFESVVRQCVDTFVFNTKVEKVGGSLEERLIRVGTALAEATLTPYVISVMRITLAETERFPEIARDAFRLGFSACAQRVMDAITADCEPKNLPILASFSEQFVEMSLHPLYFHAFFGGDLLTLRQRIPQDMGRVARLLCQDIER